jgi:hypothetical protein
MSLTHIEPRLAPLGNSFELFGALPRQPRRSRSFSGYFPVDFEDYYHFVDAGPEPEADAESDASAPTSTSDGCSTSDSTEPPASSSNSEQGSKGSKGTEKPQPAETQAQADALPSKITSLMLRNLPRKITQQDLVDRIHTSGFEGRCDFCYMPRNFNSGENQGHAFVNFVTEEAASDFHKAWHRQRPFRTNKNQPAINISAADLQGLSANLSKWDNPRMRRVRNPIYKPFMLEPTDVEQQVDGGSDEMARRRERRYLPAAASRPSSFIE